MFRLPTLRHFVHDKSGATMVEYALILSIVALILVASLTLLGEGLSGVFDGVTKTLSQGGADNGNLEQASAESL